MLSTLRKNTHERENGEKFKLPAFQPPEITTLKMSVTAVFNPFYCKIKYRYIKVYTKKNRELNELLQGIYHPVRK